MEFLEDFLSKKELQHLQEIMDFSLDPKIDLEKIQEKIAFSNYYQSHLIKILYKLRLITADLETEFEQWNAEKIHDVGMEYDGFPVLLKTPKDYEREIKRTDEYKESMTLLRKLQQTVKTLESKEKELNQFDWKMKGIIDIHKLRNNLMY